MNQIWLIHTIYFVGLASEKNRWKTYAFYVDVDIDDSLTENEKRENRIRTHTSNYHNRRTTANGKMCHMYRTHCTCERIGICEFLNQQWSPSNSDSIIMLLLRLASQLIVQMVMTMTPVTAIAFRAQSKPSKFVLIGDLFTHLTMLFWLQQAKILHSYMIMQQFSLESPLNKLKVIETFSSINGPFHCFVFWVKVMTSFIRDHSTRNFYTWTYLYKNWIEEEEKNSFCSRNFLSCLPSSEPILIVNSS